MAQQQVLEHEVVVWASPRNNGREEQPEEFEHALSIANPPSREGLAAGQLSRTAPRLTACAEYTPSARRSE